MKKGFTLIELLIVMIIVGVLVGIGLPQYKRAVERGRAMEGIALLRSITDQVNALYMLNDAYPANLTNVPLDSLKNSAFEPPTITATNTTATICVERPETSGWAYKLCSTSVQGEWTASSCTTESSEDECALLGLNAGALAGSEQSDEDDD